MKTKSFRVMVGFYIVVLIVIAFLVSCKKSEESEQSGTASVYLTDAPGPFSEVNVEIRSAAIHYTDETKGNSGWVDLNVNAGVYDLLKLRDNVTTLLATGQRLPSGTISQMRLVLGQNNSVVIIDDATSHSRTFSLKIPGGYTSGLKINVDGKIVGERDLGIVLDFDADASVRMTGDNDYQMFPVIRVKSVTN